MQKLKKYFYISFLATMIVLLSSCEKDINIKVPQDDEKLVVEAYVTNLYPNLNYVLISKTINYFNPDFSFKGTATATVNINEGHVISAGDTAWKLYNLKPNLFIPGLYSSDSLLGKIGYVYKLEIWLNNEYYKSYTTIPEIVPIDSLTQNIVYNGTTPEAFLTVHFNEPQSLGQNYRTFLRYAPDPAFLAWGDIPDSNLFLFNDDNSNGVYRHFTYIRTFNIGDTVQYYIANMDRASYNFWDSYENALYNGGPFATPIQLRSNVYGKNVIGSFSGFAVDTKRIIFKL